MPSDTNNNVPLMPITIAVFVMILFLSYIISKLSDLCFDYYLIYWASHEDKDMIKQRFVTDIKKFFKGDSSFEEDDKYSMLDKSGSSKGNESTVVDEKKLPEKVPKAISILYKASVTQKKEKVKKNKDNLDRENTLVEFINEKAAEELRRSSTPNPTVQSNPKVKFPTKTIKISTLYETMKEKDALVNDSAFTRAKTTIGEESPNKKNKEIVRRHSNKNTISPQRQNGLILTPANSQADGFIMRNGIVRDNNIVSINLWSPSNPSSTQNLNNSSREKLIKENIKLFSSHKSFIKEIAHNSFDMTQMRNANNNNNNSMINETSDNLFNNSTADLIAPYRNDHSESSNSYYSVFTDNEMSEKKKVSLKKQTTIDTILSNDEK